MSRRKLTDSEKDDWSRVARSVSPLSREARQLATPTTTTEAPAPKAKPSKEKAPASKKPKQAPRPRTSKPAAPPPLPSMVPTPASPAGLDQFATRYVRRGRGPDARIDLHGMTQAEAHGRLLTFLQSRQQSGARLVLVITGKGRSGDTGDWWSAGERGILRRAVPQWLQSSPYRDLVAGFQTAGRGHGGDGAFYVQLRRKGRNGGRGA
ncbi:Smr/MutS family protein [Tepidamorphus sp. 3E244]|uniref:Smr/MutS family protein n=1 Tax=Tepidamorphus sp. 3E244 TaxID=3385498 RepID=UPI0038FC5C31